MPPHRVPPTDHPARRAVLGGLAAAVAAPLRRAASQARALRIGVLGTTTGATSWSGPGALAATRFAAADFATQLDGRPVEVLDADFQGRPDEAVAIARRWFDSGVDAIVDMPISAAALAVQELARTMRRTLLVTAATSSDLTGAACTRVATHWALDNATLARATVQGLAMQGVRTWFLIMPAFAFPSEPEREAVAAIERAGGRLLGIARHPPETPEFEAPLRQAIGSGAQGVLLGNTGQKLVRLVRQARISGLFTPARRVAALQTYLPEIHAAGPDIMQDLHFITEFYWNQNDRTRAFARRFDVSRGMMPGRAQAETYAAVTHYLRAVAAADTSDALVVNDRMRNMPVYFFGQTAHVRADGRVLYDMTLYRVEPPSADRATWDDLAPVAQLGPSDAFRPFRRDACPIAG